jgi:MFS family permease
VAISDSFNKKHAIAFSLSQSGVGLGIFIFGPLFSFLITVYGWRGALLITGACTFQLTCLGALIFPSRSPRRIEMTNFEIHPLTEEAKCTDEEIQEILRNLNSEVAVVDEVQPTTSSSKWMNHCAAMLHLSCFFWSVATSIPYILLADYARSLDLMEYVL